MLRDRLVEKLEFCINDMLFALSYALDSVESELVGARAHHSERVALLCVETGRQLGLSDDEMLDLAACAVLHDNALTEYVALLKESGGAAQATQAPSAALRPHCEIGERNISKLSFYPRAKNAILYHHENADGSGAFGLTNEETPLYARLVHLGDTFDNLYELNHITPARYEQIRQWLQSKRNGLFDRELVSALIAAFPFEKTALLANGQVRRALVSSLPRKIARRSDGEITALAAMFAHITDCKSHVTCRHSIGIAEKSRDMGVYYGCDSETVSKLYLAGALHDIGKLTTPAAILEKPGKLTSAEWEIMKQHVTATYEILKDIKGLEDVTSWASLHHEKLDGSGYPFGKTAGELGKFERLMACMDIYQALTETRPYKDGLPHDRALSIMRGMVEDGQLDGDIVEDIDKRFGAGVLHGAGERG